MPGTDLTYMAQQVAWGPRGSAGEETPGRTAALYPAIDGGADLLWARQDSDLTA